MTNGGVPGGAAARPRCSVFIATSLDGYIARPDGGIDWLAVVERPGEDYGYRRFYDSVGALVMGRKTYDIARGFPEWPYAGKRCVVLTHAAPAPGQVPGGVELHSGDPAPLLGRLAKGGVARVYVDGGAVIRQFLDAGLIDDVTLSIIPVVLGDGIRLFQGGMAERRLRLRESRSFPSGLVQVEYEVE